VDILCPLPDREFEPILAEVGRTAPFLRLEEDMRAPDRLPARRHFKFFFASSNPNNTNSYVLLDVVREGRLHPRIDPVPIRSPLFRVEEEVRVDVPSVEGLLGDKLTAFAPNTVGIPCTENLAMQVVKQLFDVGQLFDAAVDLPAVAQAYDAIFEAENGYRGNRFTRDGALADTIETTRRLCHFQLKDAVQHEHQRLLKQGRRAVVSHLVGCTFNGAEAKVAAAKAALLAAALRRGTQQRLAAGIRYDPQQIEQLATTTLADPVLQRLKGGNPEAFHYWAKAEQV
jgi:hypothetical protein